MRELRQNTRGERNEEEKQGKKPKGKKMIVKGTKDDARLGFYRMGMTQRHAFSRGIVFKMAHSKIRLTMRDFGLYISAPINTQGIFLSAGPHVQITGNTIIGSSAGINIDIGDVSP